MSHRKGPPGQRPGRIAGWLAVTGLLALAMLGPTSALANDAPGNNGTAKIHEGTSHADPPKTDRNNQPHVCTFHVHGFNFDTTDAGRWWIYSWSPTGKSEDPVDTDTWAGEEWMSRLISLPPGHYRLVVNIVGDANEPKDHDYTADKHKLFWVECEGGGGADQVSPSPSPSPSPSGSAPGAGGVLPTTGAPSASLPTGGVLPTQGAPTGGVLPTQGAPGGGGAGLTPPPTDALGSGTSRPAGEAWRLALMALAGLIAAVMLLTPAPRRARRDRPR